MKHVCCWSRNYWSKREHGQSIERNLSIMQDFRQRFDTSFLEPKASRRAFQQKYEIISFSSPVQYSLLKCLNYQTRSINFSSGIREIILPNQGNKWQVSLYEIVVQAKKLFEAVFSTIQCWVFSRQAKCS